VAGHGFMIFPELPKSFAGDFVALILDNEVTVGNFVTNPPRPWCRLIQRAGQFLIDERYPTLLTPEQAKYEMRNWDEVSLPAIMRMLGELDGAVDYVIIGNNAGQGLPLAGKLPPSLAATRAAIIYGESLPEIKEYQKIGYRIFFRRREAASHMLALAQQAGRSPALCFINTIQHNESNYHDPR
jgi:hypothetical protein